MRGIYINKYISSPLFILVGFVQFLASRKKKKTLLSTAKIKNTEVMRVKNKIIDLLKNKIAENINNGLYIKSLKALKYSTFKVSPNGMGVQVQQLGDFVLEWIHFQKIVEKANELGGKMYRGDEFPQISGFKLGEEISHDSMEGFIASELLGIEDGMSVTRRSTYYSGILAWAGIVTLHKSKGQGSYITVNSEYRNI